MRKDLEFTLIMGVLFFTLVWVLSGCNGKREPTRTTTGTEYQGQVIGCREVYDDLFCPKVYDPKTRGLSSMKPDMVEDEDGNPIVLDMTDKYGNPIVWVKVDRNGTKE